MYFVRKIKKLLLAHFKKEYWHVRHTPDIFQMEKFKEKFECFQVELDEIRFPENQYNQMMSFVRTATDDLQLVITRYRHEREEHRRMFTETKRWEKANPQAKTYRAHPDEKFHQASIKVDTQCLLMFGTILVSRSLLLLKYFLPDAPHLSNKKEDQYHSIPLFYWWLSNNTLSPLAQELKNNILPTLKWLYAVLRFYRNEFVEHMDKPYQQGMMYNFYGKDSFRLISYKFGEVNQDEQKKIAELKVKLKQRGVNFRDSEYERHFVQMLFEDITEVPNDLLKEALEIIEKIGVESPEPELVIEKITDFMTALFSFLYTNISKSELDTYRKKS